MPDNLVIEARGETELVMTRSFNAPQRLVFEAWTTPELLKRWFGPRRWQLTECEIDLQPGGRWRYVMHSDSGEVMGMGGTFQEIEPPSRLVSTEEFDDAWYEGKAVTTTEFVEAGGRTTVITTVRYDSREVRDAVLASPMESGVAEGFDRLEELLAGQAHP